MIEQLFKYLIVPFVIGVRKGASFNGLKPNVIPLGKLGCKTRYNIPKTIFLLDLGIEYCDKLLPCRKGFHVTVSSVSFYSFFKLISRIKFQEFREYSSKFVHGLSSLLVLGSLKSNYPTKEMNKPCFFNF